MDVNQLLESRKLYLPIPFGKRHKDTYVMTGTFISLFSPMKLCKTMFRRSLKIKKLQDIMIIIARHGT